MTQTTANLKPLLVNQIKAAPYARSVILNLERQRIISSSNPEHKAIIETDVFRLRRGICLPCAVATAMNLVANRKIVGDEQGGLRVGDFFRFLLPHHGKYITQELPKGWLVVNNAGDVYHHAIVAFAQALGFHGKSITEFNSLQQLQHLVGRDSSVAVSLDNRFVVEQTLASNQESVKSNPDGTVAIRVDSPTGSVFKKFENGRHVVTVIAFDKNDILLADSFNLPQPAKNDQVVRIPIDVANGYLKYHDGSTTRAVVIAKKILKPDDLKENHLIIPGEVETDLAEKLKGYGI